MNLTREDHSQHSSSLSLHDCDSHQMGENQSSTSFSGIESSIHWKSDRKGEDILNPADTFQQSDWEDNGN